MGNRLALWALAKDYGKKDVVYSGPLYKSMKVEGNKIRLSFAHVGGGLKSRDGKPLSEFEIAGADGKFVPAEATIDGDTVVVQAKPACRADASPLRLAEHGQSEPGQQGGPARFAVPDEGLARRHRRVTHNMATDPRTPKSEPSARLMSLDALRGFDMFWIVGADGLVEGLRDLSENNSFLAVIHKQLQHAKWEGFHFEDLIFPMFVFIVGVSLVFSLSRMIEERGRSGAVARIVRRSVLLFALGIFYYGGFSKTFSDIRLLGVLQRIALAYLFAGLIFVFFGLRGRVAWCLGLLVGYWALMAFVPVPGGNVGDFDEGHNLANWIDSRYLPLHKWDGDHDPEGLLSTLPAIANCLLGVFAGMLLRNGKQKPWQKVLLLAAAGGVLLGLGLLWAHPFEKVPWLWFPLIKKIWTSSFVLVACGYSSLLLAAFYLIIDVAGWRRWAMPFVWIGVNPITIYVLGELGLFNNIAERLVGGQLNESFHAFGPLVLAIVGLLLVFAFAWFLYRRRIFIRL